MRLRTLYTVLLSIMLMHFFQRAYAGCDLIVGSNKVNISMLDKKKVFKVLYESAVPMDLGFMTEFEEPLSSEEIDEFFSNSQNGYFEYVQGRLLKVDLSVDILDTTNFNATHGENAAEKAICKFFHESIHYKMLPEVSGASIRLGEL